MARSSGFKCLGCLYEIGFEIMICRPNMHICLYKYIDIRFDLMT